MFVLILQTYETKLNLGKIYMMKNIYSKDKHACSLVETLPGVSFFLTQ